MSRPHLSFMTKGTRLPHDDSYIIINQAYVQYIAPAANPNSGRDHSQTPILFIHGGGLHGAVWETTPDLRPGWACRAAEAGYPVYLLDAVDCGRSPSAPDPAREGPVVHRTARQVWHRFRIGAPNDFELRKPFATGQFPVECFDAFLALQSPRRYTVDDVEVKTISDAIERIGMCHVIAHSHGAVLLMEALNKTPYLKSWVEQVALVEPGPARPDAPTDFLETIEGATIIWGDFLQDHTTWVKIQESHQQGGIDAEVVSLPDHGIVGNSHFPMCDRNSDAVIQLILKQFSAE